MDTVSVICPDCGEVRLIPDIYEYGIPVGGQCPTCKDRLLWSHDTRTVIHVTEGNPNELET